MYIQTHSCLSLYMPTWVRSRPFPLDQSEATFCLKGWLGHVWPFFWQKIWWIRVPYINIHPDPQVYIFVHATGVRICPLWWPNAGFWLVDIEYDPPWPLSSCTLLFTIFPVMYRFRGFQRCMSWPPCYPPYRRTSFPSPLAHSVLTLG